MTVRKIGSRPAPKPAPESATQPWTKAQAESLRAVGYTLEYVERRTGIRLKK